MQGGPGNARLVLSDKTAAIVALREAGGPPVDEDEKVDVAGGIYRLMINLLELQPYRGNRGDAVAAAAARDYALNRGYELGLRDGGLELAQIAEADALSPQDIKLALLKALRPGTSPAICPPDLVGTTLCVSHAVSDPTPELVRTIKYLRAGIEDVASGLGARISFPRPRACISRDGRRHNPEFSDFASPEDVARSDVLFTESLIRVGGGHIVVIIGDPRGQGSAVEREWSLRLGIQVIELMNDQSVHPHQDGPGRVCTIHVRSNNLDRTIADLERSLSELSWAAQDQRAVAEAYEIKNAEELIHVRNAWHALDERQKLQTAARARMSVPYINGILSAGLALELASNEQRRTLELVLKQPPHRLEIQPIRPGDRDMQLIGNAAKIRKLEGYDFIRVYEYICQDIGKSRLRKGQLHHPSDALEHVDGAIHALGIKL